MGGAWHGSVPRFNGRSRSNLYHWVHNTSDHVYAVVIQLAAVLVLEPPLAPLHSNSCKFNLAPAIDTPALEELNSADRERQ